MIAKEAREQIQAILGVKQDDAIGPKTLAALHTLVNTPDGDPWPPVVIAIPVAQAAAHVLDGIVHQVLGSSFANLADVEAFRRAKAEGKSDEEAFAVGDNGIGCWGDVTATDEIPMCALPPEVWIGKWKSGSVARGKRVAVTYNGVTVIGELRDTMPHLQNIKNGAGIDLNPGFASAFGVRPPFMIAVSWQWAETALV